MTRLIPPLKNLSDSIYVEAVKNTPEAKNPSLTKFYIAHAADPSDNLNIIHLLKCPVSKQALELSPDKKFVITVDGVIRYPVKENIPILIRSEIISN